MIYDYVIILCASPLSTKGKFDEFSPDGSYLGGQIRMQAAVDLYKSNNIRKVIVVGGDIEEKRVKEKWKKTNDMRKFLIDNGIPSRNIIRICSKKDTHGNLRAIYKTFKKKLEDKTVGILTNFYHLPRAMRFANDTQFKWKINFIPISAESVITSIPTSYLNSIPAFICRIFNDVQGLKEWENGNYRDQNMPEEEWKGEVHSKDKNIINQ